MVQKLRQGGPGSSIGGPGTEAGGVLAVAVYFWLLEWWRPWPGGDILAGK